MRLLKSRKSKLITAAACGVALGLGGIASAYFTGGGSGTGTVDVASPNITPLVIVGTAPAPLVPGAAAVQINGTIYNPNSFAVGLGNHEPRLTSTAVTVDPAHAAQCAPENFTLGTTAAHFTQQEVLAHGETIEFYSPVTVSMVDSLTVNQDGCRGATLTVNFVLP